MKKFKLAIYFLSSAVLFAQFLPVNAITIENNNNVQTENNINTSAVTGGNTIVNGELIEGKAAVKTDIETIINGQKVQDISVEETAEDGEAKVQVESQVKANNEEAMVETTTIINGEESTEGYIVDLRVDDSATSVFNKSSQATSVISDNRGEVEEEMADVINENQDKDKSGQTENVIAKIFINIFNVFKEGILKIFNIFI